MTKTISFPYFYGSEDLVEKAKNDNKSMVVYLNPILENTDLTTEPALSVLYSMELNNEFNYKFCNQISQLCGTLSSILETNNLARKF